MGCCAVPNCRYRYGCKTVSLHRFPVEPQRRLKWIKSLNRGETWRPSKAALVCSQHFTPEDFEPLAEFSANIRLKSTAVPSIFPTGPVARKVTIMKKKRKIPAKSWVRRLRPR